MISVHTSKLKEILFEIIQVAFSFVYSERLDFLGDSSAILYTRRAHHTPRHSGKLVEEKLEKVKTSCLLQQTKTAEEIQIVSRKPLCQGCVCAVALPFIFLFPPPFIWLHCCSVHLSFLLQLKPLS